MTSFFDQAAHVTPDEPALAVSRAAKWLVGERLACVLHVGDGSLAYLLSDQGHEVVIAGGDVTARRHRDLAYVRAEPKSLPFAERSFDAVVVPRLDGPRAGLDEVARVLRPGGLVSAIDRVDDESIPWLRRLRDIVGHRARPALSGDALERSGLFETHEVQDLTTWAALDRAGVQQYARATAEGAVDDATMASVHELFSENAGHTGTLRLRQITRCVRARVAKEPGPVRSRPPTETMLLDFR